MTSVTKIIQTHTHTRYKNNEQTLLSRSRHKQKFLLLLSNQTHRKNTRKKQALFNQMKQTSKSYHTHILLY